MKFINDIDRIADKFLNSDRGFANADGGTPAPDYTLNNLMKLPCAELLFLFKKLTAKLNAFSTGELTFNAASPYSETPSGVKAILDMITDVLHKKGCDNVVPPPANNGGGIGNGGNPCPPCNCGGGTGGSHIVHGGDASTTSGHGGSGSTGTAPTSKPPVHSNPAPTSGILGGVTSLIHSIGVGLGISRPKNTGVVKPPVTNMNATGAMPESRSGVGGGMSANCQKAMADMHAWKNVIDNGRRSGAWPIGVTDKIAVDHYNHCVTVVNSNHCDGNRTYPLMTTPAVKGMR